MARKKIEKDINPSIAIKAKKGKGADHEDDGHGPNRLFRIDLRSPSTAVGKDNRSFADATAGPATLIQHLLLKRVTARPEVLQIGIPQLGNAVTAISTAGVACGDAQEDSYYGTHGPADQSAG